MGSFLEFIRSGSTGGGVVSERDNVSGIKISSVDGPGGYWPTTVLDVGEVRYGFAVYPYQTFLEAFILEIYRVLSIPFGELPLHINGYGLFRHLVLKRLEGCIEWDGGVVPKGGGYWLLGTPAINGGEVRVMYGSSVLYEMAGSIHVWERIKDLNGVFDTAVGVSSDGLIPPIPPYPAGAVLKSILDHKRVY